MEDAVIRRSGRRPGRSGSREAILRAARLKFAELGYERTTVRGIAREAQVDAALVHHFFRSKEGVFAAAVHEAVRPMELMPVMLAGDPATLGERLLTTVLGLWESADRHEALLAVIRSAVSHETAAGILREFLGREILGPLAQALTEPQRALRAALLGSQLIGLIMARYIIRVEPLASASTRSLIAVYAPVIQNSLTGDLPLPGRIPPQPGAPAGVCEA
jgi:AcrR family transcriptional regulator